MGSHIIFVIASAISICSATTYLSPDQDIVLPSTSSASNPLTLLGANSPYFAGPSLYPSQYTIHILKVLGPNVNGVENIVPENCYVEQVAYVVRHGSRFPDNGAYKEWVALYNKVPPLRSKGNEHGKGKPGNRIRFK